MSVDRVKGNAKDAQLTIRLSPKRELSLPAQKQLWQKLLDPDFRTSMGRLDIDHVASGGPSESHVEYRMADIGVLLYDKGRIEIEVTKFNPKRTRQVEKMLTVILAEIGRAARKKVDLRVSGLLHLILLKPSMTRFLTKNIRFVASPKFAKVFGSKSVTSFIIRTSDTSNVVISTGGHIDFSFHDTTSTAPNRKHFVDHFVTVSMHYIDSMRMAAQ